MTTALQARAVIDDARRRGVDEFCVCAGSRNAPLLEAIGARDDVRVFTFVDERSAAFFALGRIKQHGAPVAVVTTSGTAAAELLPAAVEAHYSGLPLILITADRPARFRGTGAPQSIEQVGLFGVYGARHINVELEEGGAAVWAPFSPAESHPRDVEPVALPAARRPLVLVGGLPAGARERVRQFALQLQAPVYAEPLSGLREDPSLDALLVRNERMLARGGFDLVIRIGHVPTLRFWRDLDERFTEISIVNYSALPFAGLPRGEVHPLGALPASVEPCPLDDDFLARDRDLATRVTRILDDEPKSEQTMFRTLSRELPNGARVYLGNSLPIREWDLAATREPRSFAIEANRGANGIDGQLSTFLGWCAADATNVAVVGDLTALYDLNAPWIVPQLDATFRIVIINNRGGRIFDRVASLRNVDKRLITNAHDLHFEHWARMFGIESSVTELLPDADATARVWQRYDELWI